MKNILLVLILGCFIQAANSSEINSLLQSKNPMDRIYAISEVEKNKDISRMNDLVRIMRSDDDPTVRNQAIYTLSKVGTSAIKNDLVFVVENDSFVGNRTSALGVLAVLLKVDSIEYIRKMLNKEDVYVKLSAAGALGFFGDSSGYDIAMKSAEVSDENVARAAVEALGLIGNKESIDLLKKRANGGRRLREEVLISIKKIQFKHFSADMKLELLKTSLYDDSIGVCEWAISEMAKLGTQESIEFINTAIKDDTCVMRTVIKKASLQNGIAIKGD